MFYTERGTKLIRSAHDLSAHDLNVTLTILGNIDNHCKEKQRGESKPFW